MKFSAPLTPVRVIFIGLWILCFSVFSIIWFISYLTDNWSPSNQVEVTQFGVCTARRIPLEIKDVISPDNSQLYACGYLQTEIPIQVDIYLFEDGDQIAMNYLNTKKRGDGPFFEPVELSSRLKEGIYVLRVDYGRIILAEYHFSVEAP